MKAGSMKSRRLAAAVLALAFGVGIAAPASATPASWSGVSVTPVDPTAAATNTTWGIGVTGNVTASAAKCIKISVKGGDTDFTTGSLPAGFAWDSGAASSVGGVGQLVTGTWTEGTASGLAQTFTNAGGVTPSANPLTLTHVHNPTTSGTYFMRVQTFDNTGCSTGPLDDTVIAFAITDNTVVSGIVDPTLTFTVTGLNSACNGQAGTVIDNTSTPLAISLGHVSQSVTGAGAQNLAVTTNAAGGASVFAKGSFATGNLRNGSHNFTDSGATPPTTGTEAFGYTAADAHRAMGSNVFATLTATNAEVAYSASGNVAASCIGWQASASAATPAGSYTATVVYTAVPSY